MEIVSTLFDHSDRSEELCPLTGNAGSAFCLNDRAPRSVKVRSRGGSPPVSSHTAGWLDAGSPRQAVVEASLLNFDFLRPRTSRDALTPTYSAPRAFPAVFTPYSVPIRTPVRRASTDGRPFLRKLFDMKRRKPKTVLKPDDLPPLGGFLDEGADSSIFTLGRGLSAKGADEPKLRCTEFDENGNVTLVNGEFKKSELIAKFGLLPRDLRKIDSSHLPHILVRPSAILINLLHLRALIKHDRVLVFDAYGSTDSYTQSVFMYDLEGKLRQRETSRQAGGLPYELRALEAVLISVTTALEGEYQGVRDPVVRVLRELEEDIDRDKLRHLLVYSKKLGTFEQKAKLVRDAIDELLEADDDLAAMYLTAKAKGEERGEEDHTEVEMLLESYHKVCDEIVQNSGNLVSNIRNTEEIVKAILDANRNSLMLLDLKFSIGTLGIGSGAFIAALYGMNLKNFIEESDFGFLGVSFWSFGFAFVICAYGLHKLRRIQRVSMFEHGDTDRRRSWRNPLIGAGSAIERTQRLRRLKEMKEGGEGGVPVVKKKK
ncbi:magnesium ion transporter [Glutinoglossum americanum]|uniref:Magnesium transporter n=1 Tax=Glutinoglossum americanum TaxID=1670608 RepID=A0A9P8I036_9PEZI|nr:magnesium ion transporter [Glutinoglossum americanum]